MPTQIILVMLFLPTHRLIRPRNKQGFYMDKTFAINKCGKCSIVPTNKTSPNETDECYSSNAERGRTKDEVPQAKQAPHGKELRDEVTARLGL